MPIGPSGGGSGAGGLTKLFDSTLAAPAANIDTGANGIAGGHGDLVVYLIARTADAGATGGVQITVNGDTAAHYDLQYVIASATSPSSSTALASANWAPGIHGNGGTAGYPGIVVIEIPAYGLTTFNKVGTVRGFAIDGTAANCTVGQYVIGWRSTAAINQLTVTGTTANLQTGSRLAVYGTQ